MALVLVMAAHEAEHVAQVFQQRALANRCPTHCRGALGFVFDLEWVHFAYNASILVALATLVLLLRRGDRFLLGALALQAYHVVEHSVKLEQWLRSGKEPSPGILGAHVDLVGLHFVLNTVVFVLVVAGVFGLRLPARPRLAAAAIVALLLAPVGGAWATRTPTTVLAAGVHRGPLVLDRPLALVGRPDAVVRGGIVVRADGVTVRGVTVEDAETGIEVEGARNVLIEDVVVRDVSVDGISVRRASVVVRDCLVEQPRGRWVQAIDVSFAFDLPPSRVEQCRIVGGREGIVSHFAHVLVRRNRIEATTLRAITVTEMSDGRVEDNAVERAIGVGIFCGDYSVCDIERNTVHGTRPDRESDDGMRRGYAIQAHFGARARLAGNRLLANARADVAFADATIEHD